MSCKFCELAKGGLPPHSIYEDDFCFAILDRRSLGRGHCMLIPRRHVAFVYLLSTSETEKFFITAAALARRLQTALGVKSVGYASFGAGLHHAHLHLVPYDDAEVLLEPRKHLLTRTDTAPAKQAQELKSLGI